MCFICACVNLFLSLMCLVGAYEFGLHLCVFVYLLVCLFVCVSGWVDPGVVRAGHCGASAAVDRDVL